MILVTIVLLLFLGNVRAAIIVALTIPSRCCRLDMARSQPYFREPSVHWARSTSEMVVDGAVVMVGKHRPAHEPSNPRRWLGDKKPGM